MPQIVTMPQLGESVTEETVTRWLKNVGDHVDLGEPLVEVSTDKVDTELPSPFAGVLLSISVDVDQTAAVGAELAVIGDLVEPTSVEEPVAPPVPAPSVAAESTLPAITEQVSTEPASAPASVVGPPCTRPTGRTSLTL